MEKIMNIAILQVRMDSTRLPKKAMLEVNNKGLLQYQCERIQKSKTIDNLIIATTISQSDEPIVQFSIDNDIEYFRGSINNVLQRYYLCIKEFKEKNNIQDVNIIRLTGDCPLIDFEVIDEVVEYFCNNKYDYVSNNIIPTYPDGLDVEVCSYEALEKSYLNAKLDYEKEHIFQYIKNNDKFSKYNYKSKYDFSHLRFTIDEEKDFILIKKILENLYLENKYFTYLDVVSYMSKNPLLFNINSDIVRDEGLLKSKMVIK
jgi:spore coat polysaccharide biosynthesis protein SpsF